MARNAAARVSDIRRPVVASTKAWMSSGAGSARRASRRRSPRGSSRGHRDPRCPLTWGFGTTSTGPLSHRCHPPTTEAGRMPGTGDPQPHRSYPRIPAKLFPTSSSVSTEQLRDGERQVAERVAGSDVDRSTREPGRQEAGSARVKCRSASSSDRSRDAARDEQDAPSRARRQAPAASHRTPEAAFA